MISSQNDLKNLESLLASSGLYIQLFPDVYLSDLIRLKSKEDLTISLVQSYLSFISNNEVDFKYSSSIEINSSRTVLLFPNWRMAILITDVNRTAFLIGDWQQFNLSVIPPDIQVSYFPTPESLHVSYYVLSIAHHVIIHSPDRLTFTELAEDACKIERIDGAISEVINYIYKNSILTEAEIEGYLERYKLIEQDSLNYSSSDELSLLESHIGKRSKMNEWVVQKIKSNHNSVTQMDSQSPYMNPFDLASSLEDKSSSGQAVLSINDLIDSGFVNSLMELGNKRKTIVMQVDDTPENCRCDICAVL